MITSIKSRFQSKAARLRKDEEGVAAIEFAIIAPLMITMYFGLAEIASAISADRRISHGTNIAGDLVTQNAEMTGDEIEESLAAAIRVMGVSNASKITIDMRSYTKESDGTINNEGVVQLNPSANSLPTFNAVSLDEKILSETSGVVVTRVAYNYSPIKLRFFNTDITLTETFMLKPRRSNAVVLGAEAGKDLRCTASNYGDVTCTGGAEDEDDGDDDDD